VAIACEAIVKRQLLGNARQKVLWIGPQADSATENEFAKRSLIIDRCAKEALEREFPVSAGIVFRFDQSQPDLFAEQVESIGSKAVNHGLLVVTLADNDKEFLAMNGILKGIQFGFPILKKVVLPVHEIAEEITRHDPGPGEKEVEITGERVSEQTRLFLSRAFCDCKSIAVSRLEGGRSADDVFCVHAIFSDSRVGPRPLPFFAKVDKKEKIWKEWNNYQNIVGHFIPFHARPNLDTDRCFIGLTQGILVGNFVEQSESLWDVAKRGSAQPVIYSLFDEALRGWRLQAYVKEDPLAFAPSMFSSLDHLFDPQNPLLVTRAAAATAFGNVRAPNEIIEALKANDAIKHRVAPQHGDLHVHNVRGRRGEAILIDFNSTQYSGPLVADPASLEVSIVFEVDPPDRNTDKVVTDNDNERWMADVENLYSREFLFRAPPPPSQPGPREWMWACVRQIRLIALESQTNDCEYHFALIMHLLRRASFPDESYPDKYRRDYAYFLASQLTDDLQRAREILE
jgi:hypothetical protein